MPLSAEQYFSPAARRDRFFPPQETLPGRYRLRRSTRTRGLSRDIWLTRGRTFKGRADDYDCRASVASSPKPETEFFGVWLREHRIDCGLYPRSPLLYALA